MDIDTFGIEGITDVDREFSGSRFGEVRDAVFRNAYQETWGRSGERLFERFPVTTGSALRGLLALGEPWQLLAAARRTVASRADLRWGPDGKGYRRLLHPNGICLLGMWEITAETLYTGYFRNRSRGLVVARYSTCCTETRRGHGSRSLAMVGRVYPTTDPEHRQRLTTACFITQEDIGGELSQSINDAVLRNAPDTTPLRRGGGLPVLLATGIALALADRQPSARQLYQLAELGKPVGEPTRAPEFMQLTVVTGQPVIPGAELDFRDEVMAQIYDPGDPTPKRSLTFRIETSDRGVTHNSIIGQKREITEWREVGTITFDAAVASYNGDHVLHFNHPPWRNDRNDPRSVSRGRPVG
jgi:hypothetical protein